jgi:hypothetical protein
VTRLDSPIRDTDRVAPAAVLETDPVSTLVEVGQVWDNVWANDVSLP